MRINPTIDIVTLIVVASLMSAVGLLASLRREEVFFAWAFAASFLVASLLAALYLWRVLL